MKRTLEFVIDCGQENMDVRTFVRRYLGFSARILTALKYEGEMLKNGEPVHSNAVLKAGDTLTLTLLETGEAYEKADLPFAVLYEDEDFLVLDKPYNMPVHPSPGHDRDSVLNAAAWYFQNTPDFVFRPLYRLDRDTTGALVLAKNKFAANAKLTKTYRAVCEGETPESGCVNVPIGLKPGHKVERCAGIGDEAVTEFQTVKTSGGYSLVDFHLKTGRTHQIRVHMRHINHACVGDPLYGKCDARADQGLTRQFLHSWRVAFDHPVTGERIECRDELPWDLAAVLDDLAPRSLGRTAVGDEIVPQLGLLEA